MDKGNESLFMGSWSHDQDGHHAYIMVKTVQKSSREPVVRFSTKLGM